MVLSTFTPVETFPGWQAQGLRLGRRYTLFRDSTHVRVEQSLSNLSDHQQEVSIWDVTQMAGSVAMMLEDASVNSARAVTAAEKVLRPEQWAILPQAIRERPENGHPQLPSR